MAMLDPVLALQAQGAYEEDVLALLTWLAPIFAVGGLWAGVGIVRLRRRMRAFAGGLAPIKDLVPGDGLIATSGRVVADVPATAAITKLACVYCEYSVEEHWEREYETATADHRSVHNGKEVVAKGAYAIPFLLDDGSGRVLVEPKRARVLGTRTFGDRVERDSGIYWVDGISERPGSVGIRDMEERIIEVGETVTVVGRVEDSDGKPVIRSRSSRLGGVDESFTITVEDAARVARAGRARLRRRYAVCAICAVGLLAVLVIGATAT